MTEAMKLKMLASWKKSYVKPRQCFKRQRHHFANKGPSSQSNGFSSSRVWMWELDHKEGWALKNWHFQTVVLKKTLESPLDSKEIQPVHPEYLLEGLMLKLKLRYFGHLMRRADSFGKILMLGKTEDKKGRGWQRTRLLDGITDSMDLSLWANLGRQWWTEKPSMLQSMGLQIVRHELAPEQQQQQM